MMNKLLRVAVAALVLVAPGTYAAYTTRQAEVARRGADVMPFDLQATTHTFTKTADGGTQRVTAKNSADSRQVDLVRAHLHDIQARFLKGDFSGSVHIQGEAMPGLAQLKAADPGRVAALRDETPTIRSGRFDLQRGWSSWPAVAATPAGGFDSEGGRRILGEAREKTSGVEARSQLLAIERGTQQMALEREVLADRTG